jgi:hypothetical protein
MIVRDFSFDVIDSTTNTYQPFDIRTDTLILAPLDRYKIRIRDRYFVVIEPLQGNLDDPDPNAFVTAYSGSWAAGNTFSLNLLGQDFEQEGFAVGDEVFVYFHWTAGNSVARCNIIGLNGAAATFSIIQYSGGAPNIQSPLRAVIILLSDRSEIRPSFHFANNSGSNSPLSALPFTSPHADATKAYLSTDPADLPSPLTYNLQKYDTLEPTIVSLGTTLLGYSPLDFRRRAIIIEGTQFYAYRTNLDPLAQTPTSLYSLDGRIEVLLQAPVPVRDANLTFPCLLLHPNRKGRTLGFLPPGTLTIAGGSYTLTPSSGFTPIRSVLAVTGRDSDHPRLDIADSLALTNPVTGASGTVPTIANRPGAEFVGVMIGQDGGEWVAVMTNKEPAVAPIPGPFEVFPHAGPIYRYDSLWGELNTPNAPAGIYVVQTLLKVRNTFVPIDEIEYNTAEVVSAPYPPTAGHTILSNIYPIVLDFIATSGNGYAPYNLDFVYFAFANTALIFIPVPSKRVPPTIASALTQPSGGYGLDLNNWVGGAITLKWRIFTPDGEVYDSNELVFPSGAPEPMYFAPDNQIATISETSSHIYCNHPSSATPSNRTYETIIRVAVFQRPEGYKPILQKTFYVSENYDTNTIFAQYVEGASAIAINRTPFVDFTAYQIVLDKTNLPPGSYTIHVRHNVITPRYFESGNFIEAESYFYDFTIPAPPEPPAGPPLAPDFCAPKIPAVAGESWEGLYRGENGEWQTFTSTITRCELLNYCGCFELISVVPDTYIDIIGYFRGTIYGKVVPNGAKHKARFRGRIIRLADEYTTEDFVTSLYKAEDIVRAYTQKYQIELFLQTPCDLVNLDLLKFAWKWDVVNRSNKLLPSLIRDIRPGEIDISDSGTHVRAAITLKTLSWRDEYRRQG